MKMIKEKGYNGILCLIYYFLKSGCNASVSFYGGGRANE